MSRTGLVVLFLGVMSGAVRGAQAQTVPSTVAPGSIERQFKEQQQRAPSHAVSIPAPRGFEAPPNAAQVAIHLTSIRLDGATAIPERNLASAYQDLIGREATVADLYAAANAITAQYTKAGYALSFAIVPRQTIEDGRAEIDVVEGYVAEIRFEGDARDLPRAMEAYARQIKESKPLKTKALVRYLLLANDLPGYTVKSVFERMEGAPRGATRLVLRVRFGAVTASATIDNRGSKALGPWRGDFSAGFNNLLGRGEQIELRALLSSDATELRYGSGTFRMPVNSTGTMLVLGGSYSDSHPGVPLLSLANFASQGATARIGLEHPLVRSRAGTLTVDLFAGGQWLGSDLMASPNSRDHVYTLSTGASLWRYDAGGLTTVALHATQGLDVFDATTSHSALRSRAAGSGAYTAVNLNAMREQEFGGGFEGVLSLSGQWASRPLLSSQQCGYGGSTFGRGFDDSEMVGDLCAMGSAELRFNFGRTFIFDGLQVYGFGDSGYVEERGALLPLEKRSDRAYSAGGGIRWRFNDNLSGWVEYARPIAHDVALQGNREGRVFFAVTSGF